MKQENVRREEELKQLYSDHKEESKQREQTLLNHLEKSNDTQLKTSRTLEKIQASLHSLEERTDQGFKEVWQKLQKIDN